MTAREEAAVARASASAANGLTDDLVIAAKAQQREPELPAPTVRAALDAPVPEALARYDVVALPPAPGAAGADRSRDLLDQAVRRGHRIVTVGSAADAVSDAEAAGGDPPVVLPLPDAARAAGETLGPEAVEALLAALDAARRHHGIDAAALYLADGRWAEVARRARERWEWRIVVDGGEAATPIALGEAADATVGAERIWEERWAAVDEAVRASVPKASIVVVTYDNLAYTKLCLASVLANTAYLNYELIVVDNASTDGTPEYLAALAERHPHVRVIRNATNRGFGPANNQGLLRAAGDLLALLNNDTLVPPGWLSRLARHLGDQRLGLIGPSTNRTCNEAELAGPYQTYGEFVRFARRQANAHEGERFPIRMPMMFCVAMRRDVINRVGPLDERYEIGLFEDEDYALRVAAAGFGLAWTPEVYVHHAYHATIGKLLPTGEYAALVKQNRQRFEEKWGITWQPHRPPAPPSPPKDDRPPIQITCERPGVAFRVAIGDELPVSGWLLAPAGLQRLEVAIDGQPRGELAVGAPRPDVRVRARNFPDALPLGFAGTLPIADLAPGEHRLHLRATAADGRRLDLPLTFEVDRDVVATGRLLAFLDRPAFGRNIVVTEEYLAIWGWALSTAGITRVETVVDGEPRGRVSHGSLRPDVAAIYKDFPGAEHAGFVATLPVEGLAPGLHRLTLRIEASNGERTEIAREFEIAPRWLNIGEVPRLNARYQEWLRRHAPTAADVERAKEVAAAFAARPTLSLLAVVADQPAPLVEAMIESVRGQAYDAWELRLAVGRSAPVAVRAVIDAARAADPRITCVDVPAGDGFAAGANAALALAGGELVGLLGPTDELSPLALVEVARSLNETPATDVVYGDEDKIDERICLRWDPFFKPDWSPDLLLSMDYLGAPVFYRRSLVEEHGGFRPGFDGAERYDLALRITDATDRVRHVPRLLVSRRADAQAPVPRPEPESERRALTEALARRGVAASVEPGWRAGRWRVRYELRERPPVTVVLPTGGKLDLLRPCLDDLLHKTTYPDLRILVVDNSEGEEVARLCGALSDEHPTLRWAPVALRPFNYSAVVNRGLALVETPYLVLLNDDVTVVTPDWIEAMLEHAQRPGVGAVGAKLLFPDDTIQHAGVAMGPYEMSTHPFRHFPAEHPGYFDFPHVVRNWSAVTFACAMLRRDILAEVGGLDEASLPVAFNDTDLCLRIGKAGYRIVYTPHAALYHHESVTKTVIAAGGEVAVMRERWGDVIRHDPFYNPNLTRRGEDFGLNMG